MDLPPDHCFCPLCREIFKDPVVISCGHSVCKECLQTFWRTNITLECPVCRRRSSTSHPPINIALKILCDSLIERRSSETFCSLHHERLQLFCLDDKQPVCLVCRDSKQHDNHRFRPIGEVVSSYKEELRSALKSLQGRRIHKESVKVKFEKTVQDITVCLQSQADHTELQIKQEFKKLHQFLQDEEAATITALREEEEQKKQIIREKLEEMNTHISALSHTIKDTEEMLKANDVCFLKEFPVSMERVQISQPDPQMPSGALIHVSRYLGNLPFKVWEKMQNTVHYTPVILDPNTANRQLRLSDDLTSVRKSSYRSVPDNPERFDSFYCVLGSESFNSGKHCWDVQVKESPSWGLGVTTASNKRKGNDFYKTGVWGVLYALSVESGFTVEQKLERVRVDLNYDRGTVSFSDPLTNTHLHTITTTFTESVFPFFDSIDPLKILPIKKL